MKDFLMKEYKAKDMSLQKLNSDFIEKYFQYLQTEKSISHNTACKYLTCVRTILLPAIRSGVLKNDPFYGLRISSKPVSKSFFTQDAINKIARVDLNDPGLERKRDIFLFSWYIKKRRHTFATTVTLANGVPIN